MVFIEITLGPPGGSVLFGERLRLRFSVRKETRLLALCPGLSLLRAADVPIGTAALQRGAQVEAQLLHRRPAEEPIAIVDLVDAALSDGCLPCGTRHRWLPRRASSPARARRCRRHTTRTSDASERSVRTHHGASLSLAGARSES